MGAWGSGLYSNDDAADFLETVRAILKQPQPIDDLVDLLQTEAKTEVGDETTFWLVMADQLEKRGIRQPTISEKAIAILVNGDDIEELRTAGADDLDLEKRRKSNAALLPRLKAPRAERPRKTLKKPQPAAVAAGDFVCFPTQHGNGINPYFPVGTEDFVQDGWGLIQIHDVGWEFEYLNWVKLFPLKWPHGHRPTLRDAIDAKPLDNLGFGTLSVSHFKRMQMTKLGNEPPRTDAPPPGQFERSARFVALNNVSVSNWLLGLT